jgi:hypothetical protein
MIPGIAESKVDRRRADRADRAARALAAPLVAPAERADARFSDGDEIAVFLRQMNLAEAVRAQIAPLVAAGDRASASRTAERRQRQLAPWLIEGLRRQARSTRHVTAAHAAASR